MSTKPERLAPDRLRRHYDPAKFEFKSTAELEKLDFVIGQDRAAAASSSHAAASIQGFG